MDEWTQEDRDRAVQNTDILSLAATVMAACIFHSGGVLTTTPVAGRKLWPYIEAWFCGGNPHIVIETYCLPLIDHKFWLILLRAALGRLPLNEIMPTYFRDVQVKEILDKKPSPEELQCLSNLFRLSITHCLCALTCRKDCPCCPEYRYAYASSTMGDLQSLQF
jgi:hypothetical protein